MKVAVTGASGFVGQALISRLIDDGHDVVPIYRHNAAVPHGRVVGDINGTTDWREALKGVSHIIHTAARVHVMNERAHDSLHEFRAVNVAGTQRLAQEASAMGVRRFIFISSIKVNGEATLPGRPFTPDSAPDPQDPYGVSKYEAEAALFHQSSFTGMESVIIRPPLIYGPGVKANFLKLLQAANRGLPLPIGAITHNRRSLVGIRNLTDLIMTCLLHPKAANQIFLASDQEDVSTMDLFSRLATFLGRPCRAINVPIPLLTGFATLVGKTAAIHRLTSSLQIDSTKMSKLLDWNPPFSLDDGLREVAENYKARITT